MRFDHTKITERGGLALSDSDFAIVACSNCGCQYLYDHEILTLYLDPTDLTHRHLNTTGDQPATCRECGTVDFDWSELPIESTGSIESGPWAWTLTTDQ